MDQVTLMKLPSDEQLHGETGMQASGQVLLTCAQQKGSEGLHQASNALQHCVGNHASVTRCPVDTRVNDGHKNME